MGGSEEGLGVLQAAQGVRMDHGSDFMIQFIVILAMRTKAIEDM